MPHFSKQQFSRFIKDDGRIQFQMPRMPKSIWDKLTIDQKNEAATDDMVEDGWQLEDISFSVKQVGDQVDVTVNADASNWNQNEE